MRTRDREGYRKFRVRKSRRKRGTKYDPPDVAGGRRGDCCLVLGMSSDTENTKTTYDLTTLVATPLPSTTLSLLSLLLIPSLSVIVSLLLPFTALLSLSLSRFFVFSSLFHSLFHLTPRPRHRNVRRSRSSGKEDAWLDAL